MHPSLKALQDLASTPNPNPAKGTLHLAGFHVLDSMVSIVKKGTEEVYDYDHAGASPRLLQKVSQKLWANPTATIRIVFSYELFNPRDLSSYARDMLNNGEATLPDVALKMLYDFEHLEEEFTEYLRIYPDSRWLFYAPLIGGGLVPMQGYVREYQALYVACISALARHFSEVAVHRTPFHATKVGRLEST